MQKAPLADPYYHQTRAAPAAQHSGRATPKNKEGAFVWRYTEARFFTQIYPRWWGRNNPTVIAAAITSRLDKHRLPTHINIRAADTGLAKDSVVLLEQIRTLDKHRLRERAGQITPEDQKRVDQALDVSLGLGSFG